MGDKSAGVIKAISSLIANPGPTKLSPSPFTDDASPVDLTTVKLSEPPNYTLGQAVRLHIRVFVSRLFNVHAEEFLFALQVATRVAYGTALTKLGQSNSRVVAMDGDTKNSTFSDKFRKAFPDRYVECFIAEQNLIGVAIGCGTRGRTIPFVSTFAAFFSRAFDQLRMGAISQANIKCVGSHAGISIGELREQSPSSPTTTTV